MDVELSERARRALRRLQPGADLGSSIEAVTLEAVRLRLHDVADQLAGLEARYGRTFEQFAADWNAGGVADRFSHRIERDFMEWEALAAERHELLSLIRELSAPADAAS